MSGTHSSRRRRRLWHFANADFDEASWALRVDGQDVEAVHLAALEALGHARAGSGPVFLLCETERLTGHYIGDPQVYRDKDDLRRLDEVLDFWFGPPDGAGAYPWREIWFQIVPEFDAELRARFIAHHEDAAAGRFDHLATTPFRTLAVVILLDQMPRNIFRGTPRMYANDCSIPGSGSSALISYSRPTCPV